jgi:hypothetical protein
MNLPILLVGGGSGSIKGNRHIQFPEETPLANLHVSLMSRLGLKIESFGDSTGGLSEISA